MSKGLDTVSIELDRDLHMSIDDAFSKGAPVESVESADSAEHVAFMHQKRIDGIVSEIKQKCDAQAYAEAKREREDCECVYNLQQHYETAHTNINAFGTKLIRTIVTEYLIKHNPQLVKMQICSAPSNQNDVEPPKSGEWCFVDNSIVAYQPEFINSLHSTPPSLVYFYIPQNFFPSIYDANDRQKALAESGSSPLLPRQTRIPNAGEVSIDVEAFFRNYYLAIRSGLPIFRIPFVLRRQYAENINFNVKINFVAQYGLQELSDYTDFELNNLLNLAKDVAADTITSISQVIEDMHNLSLSKKKLADEMSRI